MTISQPFLTPTLANNYVYVWYAEIDCEVVVGVVRSPDKAVSTHTAKEDKAVSIP